MPKENKTPLYRKIVDDITHRITSGELAPGAKLPSEKELRKAYDVSHITVVRVFRELLNAGIVSSRNGTGYFAAPAQQKFSGIVGNFMRPFRAHAEDDNYFNEINLAMREEAARLGISLLDSYNAPNGNDVPENILNAMLEIERLVDGFLIDERIPDRSVSALLDRTTKPVVIVNRRSELPVPTIVPDNANGMRSLLKMAEKYRFERFVFCSSNLARDNERERAAAFRKFFSERGVEESHIRYIGDIQFNPPEVTWQAVRQTLLDFAGHPLLFVTGSDYLGRWLADMFAAEGRKFDGALGVAGFDGLAMARRAPRLTTVDSHPELIGRAVITAFHEELTAFPARRARNIATPVSIVFGDTL